MPVRDLDYFFLRGSKNVRLVANRGANGIDGVVSTAMGISASEGDVLLVLGDVSFYHDMNGLLASKLYKLNATIVVVNNRGGGIFSFLSQRSLPKDLFEQLFGEAHDIDFSGVRALYGGEFTRVSDWGSLDRRLGVIDQGEGAEGDRADGPGQGPQPGAAQGCLQGGLVDRGGAGGGSLRCRSSRGGAAGPASGTRPGARGLTPPLVLLHGFTGTHRTWDELSEALAEEHFLIVPDLPGHGKSGVSNSKEGMGVRATAEAVAELLRTEAGGRKAAVLGYSLGGRVALDLACAREDLLSRLVVEGASPGLERADEREDRRARDDALADDIEARGVGWFVDHWQDTPLFATQKDLPRELFQRVRRDRLSNSARGLAMSLRAAGTGRMAPLWGEIEGLGDPGPHSGREEGPEVRGDRRGHAGEDPREHACGGRGGGALRPRGEAGGVRGAGRAIPRRTPRGGEGREGEIHDEES